MGTKVEPTVRKIEIRCLLKKSGKTYQKERPDRIGGESCDDDRPRLSVLEQAQPMDFPGAFAVRFIAIALDISQFVSAKAFLPLRLVVKRKPEKEPAKPGD